ncbi:hypothetical protein [Bacteroides xylanisolvens]|uniref:hypothetical protein n=1 Tax=Bacteroides xylanisolvens TaxID=371601 RepID=UPI001C3772FE|nr:hypothetical protein [Bacteroides xylanisolvens]MBV3830476.1 hypothetical protein [Bacteroides xylanisolvens]MBV3873943.1 hypothetical protein [Bacteroides xylanisolvens]MBV3878801.1 hypothetical protein [Bacteroides xylanisolvens]MBV3905118.1 hypothetical protein [Bacteroides xylanisolvens]MBV3910787.1 hypothetical protein [Bacteroides xylanisolvens]
MKKKFVRVMLFGALTLTVSTAVTSCKDYDDDIKGLQEQVDKITSASPVSTEDMNAAVDKASKELKEQLAKLEKLVNDPSSETSLTQQIADLQEALKTAVGENAKDLAGKLATAQNDLAALKKALGGDDYINGLKKKITDLETAKSTLQTLIDAEAAYQNNKDISGYKNTGFDAYLNQEILNAIGKEGSIALYVDKVVKTAVGTVLADVNKYLSENFKENADLAAFVKEVNETLFSKEYKAQMDKLNLLLAAIDKAVGDGSTYEDYAAVIKQIDETKQQLAGLELPSGEGVTFNSAVKDIIQRESEGNAGIIKGLEEKLQKEIDAIKGMIQSIVYVPEYADGQVLFNTYYMQFDDKKEDWKPVVNVDEVTVKFRVSPSAVVADLVANFGEENAKYDIAVDCQKVKTRALNDPFTIKGIKTVEGESNLIEVTLDASAVSHSYAVALTVKDKVATDKKTLNDVSSNYFAAVKSDLYISKVEWASANGAVATVKKGATIDYMENDGDTKVSDYELTVNTSIDGSGKVSGTSSTKTLAELGISDKYFKVAFAFTDKATAEKSFELKEATGVLTAKGDAGSKAIVKSTVTVTDPATAGDKKPVTKEYTAKEYTEVKIVSEGEAQVITLKSTESILWNAIEKPYDITTIGADGVDKVIAAIKNALNMKVTDKFSSCTFDAVAQDQTIKLGSNSGGELALIIPKETTCAPTDITTKITNGDYTVDVTVKGVTVTLPDAENKAFKLVANTYTDGTLLINLGKDVNGKVNAVTASRSLKELYTNYDKVYENLVTTVGGTMEFALADDVQKDATPEERKGVEVTKDGTVTVSNDYDGKPIKVTLEGKCGKEKIFAITIPVVIPANELNGTFGYKDAKNTKFEYDVKNATARTNGLDLTTAFVWKDGDKKNVWPTADNDTYGSNNAMDIYNFSIVYSLSGKDASSFEVPTISDSKLKLIKSIAETSTIKSTMEVVVTATPTSPWGSMVGQAKSITVTVPTWVDKQ